MSQSVAHWEFRRGINPVNLEAEYYKDGHFISTEAEKVVEGEDESAEIRLLAKEGDPWSYNRTWTIGRLQNGHYETLNYLGIRFEDGKLDLTVRPELTGSLLRTVFRAETSLLWNIVSV